MVGFAALEDDPLVLTLSSMDPSSVCRAAMASRRLRSLSAAQFVWKQLYHRHRKTTSLLQPPTDWLVAFKRLNPAWDDATFKEQDLAWHTLGGCPAGVGGQVDVGSSQPD
jgi:hypothetical protein